MTIFVLLMNRMDSIDLMNVHTGLLAAVIAALLVMRQAGEVAGCQPGLTQLVRFDSPGLQTFRAVACLSVKKFEGVIRLRMNWYYRMMLSYTPIFFVAVSSLIIVFFTMLNNASEKKYIETNQAIVEQIMRNTDANLKLIERNVVSEMQSDKTLQSFFTDEPKTLYDFFLIQKKLVELKASLPFFSSVYLYDAAAGKVLTDSDVFTLDSFGDRSFIEAFNRGPVPYGWTKPRAYGQSQLDRNKQPVVSLVKLYPFASEKRGAVVVNVYVSSLFHFIRELNENESGSVGIMDENMHPFFSSAQPDEAGPIAVRSEYTGWNYYADSVLSGNFSVVSLLSDIWAAVIFVIILATVAWFTLITHIHYKPIQMMADKIKNYTARKSGELGIKSLPNELAFIDTAIDQLLQSSMDYENLHKQDRLLRQRTLFMELLSGLRVMTQEEWEKQMEAWELPYRYERLGIVMIEIDEYGAFAAQYKPGDQYLLKFLIETAYGEMAQKRGVHVWHSWTEPHRLSIVHHLGEEEASSGDTLPRLAEEFRAWINDNLDITVSAGISEEFRSIEAIASYHRQAAKHLSYKAVFGVNVVIDSQIAETKLPGGTYRYFEPLTEMIRFYKLYNEQWQDKLRDIFGELKRVLLTRNDLARLTNDLIRELETAMRTLPAGIQRLWTAEYRHQFEQAARHAETVEELQDRLHAVMNKLARDMERERINRDSHAVADRIKAYIDLHYADPDLSLIQVSDHYKLSPRVVSHLFKEATGEKFMDYVLKVRFGHARRLLLETDEPIQSIAEQVGYLHVISFHRAFKKMFGVPPGEYRNMHRSREG